MNEHRYILKPYQGPASRHTCPACGHKKTFSRYIDNTTGEYLIDNVGRCNRENNCGYHYTPKQFFTDNPNIEKNEFVKETNYTNSIENKPIDLLPFELMDKSVTNHKYCSLFSFLAKLFGEEVATELCLSYFVGTNKTGDTVFWQVDTNANVRQAKSIQYDNITGHRNKETGVIFIGKKILSNPEANLQQCFFGEYLLTLKENEKKAVAIVESEKTALIASIYFQDLIWLATGGKYGAKWTEQNVCKVLNGKKVILFPDLGAFESWKAKGLLLAAVAGCKVSVSDILENNATKQEIKDGLDIADYLLREQDESGLALTDYLYPVIWDLKRELL